MKQDGLWKNEKGVTLTLIETIAVINRGGDEAYSASTNWNRPF